MQGARSWRLYVGILSIGWAAGCDAESSEVAPRGGNGNEGGGAASAEPCGAIDSSLAAADAQELFAGDHVPVFDLYLPEDEWENLKLHAVDEQYVRAQACYDGKAIGAVGLRFKGAYGSLLNCFDASGRNSCRKLGMKLKFDKYDAERRHFGLKRLNFHGYRYDDTYLKERISYDLYREMGIVAPRAAWAVLRVNGRSEGLFGMVEEVDGRFTKSRWPADGDGNLYKEAWPSRTDEAWIREHLQTNEEVGDIASMLAFSADMQRAGTTELRSTLAGHIDLDYLDRYMAVDDAIANFDGITTYYTSGPADEAGNHNFFLYEHAHGQFTLIPWDLESTLSLASNFGNVPSWQIVPEDCTQTYPVWGGRGRVAAPGCDAVFRALNADLAGYRVATERLLEGPMAEAPLLSKIDALAGFIRAEAAADLHGPSESRFEGAVQLLKQEIPKLRRRLEHLQSGRTSVPLVIDVDGATDFESIDDYGLLEGTTQLSNPNSTVSVELHRADPIAGAQTLRILFDHGNEQQPWQQWSFYGVPVLGQRDVTRFTALRFKARSEAPRSLRVAINSPGNSRGDSGILVGWEVALTREVQTFSFELRSARVPSWAEDPRDDLLRILETVTGLSFHPDCVGRDASGQLPSGVRDRGWIDIDDLEFY
jgi:spore coat protein CotH